MTTEMITLKLDHLFLRDIDALVKKERYQNRTEFIRNALREKLEEARMREAAEAINKLRGMVRRKTTDEEYERMRTEGFEAWAKRVK